MSNRITSHENCDMDFVYCGGRFDFDYRDVRYVEKAAQDYRAISSPSPVQLSDHLTYVGPFYFETDGMLDRDIVETEMRQIEKCTAAVFLLDNRPCPGTIAEMVYAATLNKKIAVAYLKDENETESELQSSCWYPIILCQKINGSDISLLPYTDYLEGRDKILQYLQADGGETSQDG